MRRRRRLLHTRSRVNRNGSVEPLLELANPVQTLALPVNGRIWTLPLVLSALGIAMCAPASAAAEAPPPGLPGPPPGAAAGFPLPPPPGGAPDAEAPAGPVSIPARASGPGLLTGVTTLRGYTVRLSVACSTAGNVTLSAPSLARGALAQARYRCSRFRAAVRLVLPPSAAREIAKRQSAIADLQFRENTTTERLDVLVVTRPPSASFWTSDYGLRCNRPGYQASLTAPNFSDTTTTTVDVRPWLAWYTGSTGWRWLGTAGVNASRWYRWSATPHGVAEWQEPGGTLTPWTWSPIVVAPGRGTYVVAVFEAIYWYSRPLYVWSYANAGNDPHLPTTYCAYP